MAHRLWNIGAALAASALATLLLGNAVFAQQPSAREITNSLLPKQPMTRSIGVVANPTAAHDQQCPDGLKGKSTRGITVEERTKVAEIAHDKPSIDLEVNFDYDSAAIGPHAIDALTSLGEALHDPRLKGMCILLAGHTDAKGGDAYNHDLSDRRADAVKHFLIDKFGLSAENLVAVGYGKEQLKNPADPFAPENRRVQVVNLSAQ